MPHAVRLGKACSTGGLAKVCSSSQSKRHVLVGCKKFRKKLFAVSCSAVILQWFIDRDRSADSPTPEQDFELAISTGIDPSDHRNQRLAPVPPLGPARKHWFGRLNPITSTNPPKHGCSLMRISNFTATILTVVALSTPAAADDDFSALLADLSFGDAPSLNQSLAVAESKTAESLQPVPTGMVMPEMVEAAPQEEKPAPQSPSKVALQDPVPAPISVSSDPIDLEAAFAMQDLQSDVPAQTVGHLFGIGDDENCDECITCTPRQKVRLPSSTLREYFRSSTCYTNVWDGYTTRCPSSMSHLRGECDCFKEKKKFGCHLGSGNSCDRGGCASCDSGCGQ